jgi:hypothetical protein
LLLFCNRLFQPEVRNLLFDEGNGSSHDLPARNIQRGRDHGIPSYNVWRQFCGLKLVDFSDSVIVDHDRESSDILKSLYRYIIVSCNNYCIAGRSWLLPFPSSNNKFLTSGWKSLLQNNNNNNNNNDNDNNND